MDFNENDIDDNIKTFPIAITCMQFTEIIKDSKPSAQRANSLEIKGNWSRELVRKIIENEEIDIVLTNDRARLNSSNARSDASYFTSNAKCQLCSKSGTNAHMPFR